MKSKKISFRPDKFILSLSFLVLGFMLISGFGLKRPAYQRKGYQQGQVQAEESKVKGFDSPKKVVNPPLKIIIPNLAIDLAVKPAKLISGYWEVFEDTAGWGEGSGAPGEPGNQVIFAHARQGLFLPLKNIQKDDLIYIFTKQRWYAYKVTEIREVYPSDTSEILPTDDETLTLYTCTGFADSKRLIVSAKPLN